MNIREEGIELAARYSKALIAQGKVCTKSCCEDVRWITEQENAKLFLAMDEGERNQLRRAVEIEEENARQKGSDSE